MARKSTTPPVQATAYEGVSLLFYRSPLGAGLVAATGPPQALVRAAEVDFPDAAGGRSGQFDVPKAHGLYHWSGRADMTSLDTSGEWSWEWEGETRTATWADAGDFGLRVDAPADWFVLRPPLPTVDALKNKYIAWVIALCGDSRARACEVLGLSLKTLGDRLGRKFSNVKNRKKKPPPGPA